MRRYCCSNGDINQHNIIILTCFQNIALIQNKAYHCVFKINRTLQQFKYGYFKLSIFENITIGAVRMQYNLEKLLANLFVKYYIQHNLLFLFYHNIWLALFEIKSYQLTLLNVIYYTRLNTSTIIFESQKRSVPHLVICLTN